MVFRLVINSWYLTKAACCLIPNFHHFPIVAHQLPQTFLKLFNKINLSLFEHRDEQLFSYLLQCSPCDDGAVAEGMNPCFITDNKAAVDGPIHRGYMAIGPNYPNWT